MWHTPSLSLLLSSLWLGMEVPVRVPSMGQIKMFHYSTVCKEMSNVEKNISLK